MNQDFTIGMQEGNGRGVVTLSRLFDGSKMMKEKKKTKKFGLVWVWVWVWFWFWFDVSSLLVQQGRGHNI